MSRAGVPSDMPSAASATSCQVSAARTIARYLLEKQRAFDAAGVVGRAHHQSPADNVAPEKELLSERHVTPTSSRAAARPTG